MKAIIQSRLQTMKGMNMSTETDDLRDIEDRKSPYLDERP
jgi:hypothetical protein